MVELNPDLVTRLARVLAERRLFWPDEVRNEADDIEAAEAVIVELRDWEDERITLAALEAACDE